MMNGVYSQRIKLLIFICIVCFFAALYVPCDCIAETKDNITGPWGLRQYIDGEKPSDNLIILLKGASVAPEGSSWWNFLQNEIIPDIHQLSMGLIDIKMYPGGVLGDEIDTIKLLHAQELSILGVTNMGLTQMIPEMCVLELPFLFDWEPDLFYAGKRTEVDYILEKLVPTASRLAIKHGYEFAGFLETCFETLATKIPLRTVEDLTRLRFWYWRGDMIRQDINKAFGLKTQTFELYEIGNVLRTGFVDTTVCAWYVSIILQWWPHIKYAVDYPFYGYESATFMFHGRFYDQLIPFFDKWGYLYGLKNGADFKERFLKLWKRHLAELRFLLRRDEAIARKNLLKEKIKEVHFPEAELEKLRNRILPLYDNLADKKYPKSLLDEILKYREEYRRLKKEGKLDNNWYENGVMPNIK